MRNISELIKTIIPPADYEHRNGFNNEPYLDSLSESERGLVEDELIKMIEFSDDSLIAETLAYLKSTKSLKILNKKLDSIIHPREKIKFAASIFKINPCDHKMADIAYDLLLRTSDTYDLIAIFYYLTIFNDSRINEKIKCYFNSKDILISYNSKRAMDLFRSNNTN